MYSSLVIAHLILGRIQMTITDPHAEKADGFFLKSASGIDRMDTEYIRILFAPLFLETTFKNAFGCSRSMQRFGVHTTDDGPSRHCRAKELPCWTLNQAGSGGTSITVPEHQVFDVALKTST